MAAGLVVTVAVLVALAADTGSAPRRPPYRDFFPEGVGRAVAERTCLICHSAMLVTQQAKDSAGWAKTLATMKAWGTPMTEAEQETLQGYLLDRFGPRPAKKK